MVIILAAVQLLCTACVGVVLVRIEVRQERDFQALQGAIDDMLTGHHDWARIRIRERSRAQRGLCTCVHKDGTPCELKLNHKGYHKYPRKEVP